VDTIVWAVCPAGRSPIAWHLRVQPPSGLTGAGLGHQPGMGKIGATPPGEAVAEIPIATKLSGPGQHPRAAFCVPVLIAGSESVVVPVLQR
jgi:hypothetical protein